MSKMNELAAALDELTSTANQLRTIALDLVRATVLLRDSLDAPAEEPAGPAPTEEPGKPKPRAKKPQPEPEPESEPEKPEPAAAYTKEQVRAMLAGLANGGHREEAKALVAKYANGGSFSDIDPERYPELADEVKQYA